MASVIFVAPKSFILKVETIRNGCIELCEQMVGPGFLRDRGLRVSEVLVSPQGSLHEDCLFTIQCWESGMDELKHCALLLVDTHAFFGLHCIGAC